MTSSTSSVRHVTFVDAALKLTLGGFLFLAAYAAFEGLYDIIVAEIGKQEAGELKRYYIFGAVCLITVAMWALLEVALRRGDRKRRIIAAISYVVLALWSIGFGYGFWWKVIASRMETRAGIEASTKNVSDQVNTAEVAIRRVEGLLVGVISAAEGGKQKEVDEGGSCGIASKPGRGPLAARREAVTTEIDALKTSLHSEWIGPLRAIVGGPQSGASADIPSLRQAQDALDPKNMRGMSDEQRAETYQRVRKSSESAISRIGVLNKTQGTIFASRFNALADRLEQPAAAGSNHCHDPGLAAALRTAAAAASDSPKLTLPEFEINEGAAATVKAFNKIWANVFWASYSIARSVGADISPGKPEPFSRQDTIALIASIVVDVCIFVLAFVRVRKPLDAGHRFQQAARGEREKLEMTLKAFASDVNLDVRRVFNSSIMRFGKEHFFILPHLSAPMHPGWRPSAGFLQNILVVLESMGAIDKSFESVGLRAALRSWVPGWSMHTHFERAAEQMMRFGWAADPAAPPTAIPTAKSSWLPLSLHRFRHDDLLELLLVARGKNIPSTSIEKELVNVSSDIDARRDDQRRGLNALRKVGVGFNRVARSMRRPREMPADTIIGDGTLQPVAGDVPNLVSSADDGGIGRDVVFANQADVAADAPASSLPPVVTFSDYIREDSSTRRSLPVSDSEEQHELRFDSQEVAGAVKAEPASEPTSATPRPTSPMSLEGVFSAIDDLSRGISFAEDQSQAEGLQMRQRRLTDMLRSEGLEPVARIGDRFDPEIHEALLAQNADGEPNRILGIENQGYRDRLSNRLVRRARVVVSSGQSMTSDRAAGSDRSEARYADHAGRA